ncbi:hypothetical protein SEA_KEANU_27 [Streptomyces phage Keanu]|nr:hypothetical protein SEA_KEANU_27 [Streptomyces phage Keanu]
MTEPVGDAPPMPHEAEADVPLEPIEGVTDQRVLDIATMGAQMQALIRDRLPGSPNVELACRYVDLAVQASYVESQENPPAASGEPTPQA